MVLESVILLRKGGGGGETSLGISIAGESLGVVWLRHYRLIDRSVFRLFVESFSLFRSRRLTNALQRGNKLRQK